MAAAVRGSGAGSSSTLGLASAFLGSLPGQRDLAVAILNGLFGDTLEARGSALATPMTIRAGGIELPIERRALATALTDAGATVTGRIWCSCTA